MGGVCPCFAGVAKPAEGKAQGATAQKQQQPPKPATAGETRAQAAAQESAPLKGAEEPSGTGISIGSFLDVYSNSYEKWCPGVVQKIDQNLLSVAYQTPGESPAVPNINIKTLPADTPELRLPDDNGPCIGAVVEIYSHSKQSWCPGVIQMIQDAEATIAFFYPDVPPGAEPTLKKLQLGDQDLRLFGVDGAAQAIAAGGQGQENIDVGSPVEVFSNSMNTWCPGTVLSTQGGVVTVSFYYPDMDPEKEAPVTKELPLGHSDLRVACYDASALQLNPDVNPDDFVVNRRIEVYSASRQQWLPGHISEVNDGVVTAAFKYPDMPADSEIYNKELPIGHPHLRLAGN